MNCAVGGGGYRFPEIRGGGGGRGVTEIMSFVVFFVENVYNWDFKVPIAPNYKGVCLQNTSKPHSYHLMVIVMTLWIGNSAVLKSSSQWQLK